MFDNSVVLLINYFNIEGKGWLPLLLFPSTEGCPEGTGGIFIFDRIGGLGMENNFIKTAGQFAWYVSVLAAGVVLFWVVPGRIIWGIWFFAGILIYPFLFFLLAISFIVNIVSFIFILYSLCKNDDIEGVGLQVGVFALNAFTVASVIRIGSGQNI